MTLFIIKENKKTLQLTEFEKNSWRSGLYNYNFMSYMNRKIDNKSSEYSEEKWC